MSLLTDLRLDVGDFDTTTTPVAASGSAGALTGILVMDLRVDVADDDGIVNVVYPVQASIWTSTSIYTTSYVVQPTDSLIFVFSNPATLTFPSSPTIGTIYDIKDALGMASSGNITLDPSPNTIDGSGSYIMTLNRQSITMAWNGLEWSIL